MHRTNLGESYSHVCLVLTISSTRFCRITATFLGELGRMCALTSYEGADCLAFCPMH